MRRSKNEMAKIKERLLSLRITNPYLSQAALARHFDVSEATAAKWLKNYYKWRK